jgi:ribonuclease R
MSKKKNNKKERYEDKNRTSTGGSNSRKPSGNDKRGGSTAPKGKKPLTLSEEVYRFFVKNPKEEFNYKQLSAALLIDDQDQRLTVATILSELENRELIQQTNHGNFKLAPRANDPTGIVDRTNSGTVYVKIEGYDVDISILPNKHKNAMKGDVARVHVYPNRGSRRQEGEIVEIVQRAHQEFVGTVQLSARYAFVIPSDSRVPFDFFIPLSELNGAKDKQKVVVRVLEWPENLDDKPVAVIKEVLGDAGDNNTEMNAIMAEYGLPVAFDKAVDDFAKNISNVISEKEIAKRRDFRNVLTVTIDPFDAKDFDDALSFQALENGNFEVGVHIADVSHYLTENTILDNEAVKRATSVYLVDRCVPMLPETLSNFLCSLRPHEEKLTFSAVFEITPEAVVVNEWFGRTIINSDHRFTYEEAQQIIEVKKATDAKQPVEMDFMALYKQLGINKNIGSAILELYKLHLIIRAARFKNGAVNFNAPEVKFKLDANGKPLGTYIKQSKESNNLIEEFMLLANKRVAAFIGKSAKSDYDKQITQLNAKPKGSPTFVYRVHDKPNPEKMSAFIDFIKQLGYDFKGGSDKQVSESMNALVDNVKGKGEQNLIETMAIRTMAKAIYTTENIGHYGLSFDYYTHFTSPIRRYPDVMVHRLLQHYLDGGTAANKNTFEALCKHSSDREKLAAEAERASIKYKQVEFMKDRIGAEFAGTISGVTEWGMFVEVTDTKCEGLVRMKDIPGDYFEFDEKKMAAVGVKTKKVYRLGDTVRIEVKRADLAKKQLDFLLVVDKV